MTEVMVIARYRPNAGMEDAPLTLISTHLPTLRAEGLVGEGPSLAGRAKDGTIVEIFCWKSPAAIDAAHQNEKIGAMWEKFSEVCDFVAIGDVAGAADLFTALEPLSF